MYMFLIFWKQKNHADQQCCTTQNISVESAGSGNLDLELSKSAKHGSNQLRASSQKPPTRLIIMLIVMIVLVTKGQNNYD